MADDLSGRAGLERPARVLLCVLNLQPRNERLVREVSDSLADPSIKLTQYCFDSAPAGLSREDLSSAVETTLSDLILLVLSPECLRASNQLPHILKNVLLRVPVIGVIDPENPNDLAILFGLGILDFIVPPFKPLEILGRIWRWLNRTDDRLASSRPLSRVGLDHLVGEAPVFVEALRRIKVMAECDVSVLISGETGTGKEMFASSIHNLSARRHKPFLPVNCGAIPLELFENEFFGHERGAFTGASNSHDGFIQQANGGTIMLDEVDSLPPLAQVKLLRFLQSKEFRPLGSSRVMTADVRTMATSNADLESAVMSGKLRQDLYYRLNVVPLRLPALRERRGDIPLLVQHFLHKYGADFNKDVRAFSASAMRNLCLHEWPGNVRELEHVVERAVLLSDGKIIRRDMVILAGSQQKLASGSFQEMKAQVVAQFERSYIHHLLLVYGGNITRAAQAAGKERRTFWELIRKHNIDVGLFKRDSSKDKFDA